MPLLSRYWRYLEHVLERGLALHALSVVEVDAGGDWEAGRDLPANLLQGLDDDAAAVLHASAVLVGAAVASGAEKLVEHEPVSAVELHTVAAGAVGVLGGVGKGVLNERYVVLGHLAAGSEAPRGQLRGHGAGGHGSVALVELGAGFAARMVELYKQLAAVAVHALGQDAHGVAVVQIPEEALAGHGDAAVLGADDADKADLDEARAALGLGDVILNRALRYLARGLAQAVVHRGHYDAVAQLAAVYFSLAEKFVVHIHILLSVFAVFIAPP